MIPDPAESAGLEEDAEIGSHVREGHGSLTAVHAPAAKPGAARDRWHSRNANRFPSSLRLFGPDLPRLIRESIVPGYAPEAGMLSAEDRVVTIGSCFARELGSHLRALGLPPGTSWTPPRLNNTFAIRDFVSWCVTGDERSRGYRYDRDGDKQIREWVPEAEREVYLQGLRDAGAVICHLAFAEVWQDRETGVVFWRGIPKDVHRRDRHEIRLTTVEENEENIVRTVELIRSVNATAPIVLTIGPGPLAGTFRGVAPIPADCVSKAVLRVAVERILDRRLEGVYYWPLFETIRWIGGNLPWRAFGADNRRPRTPTRYLVAESMAAFVEAFCTPEALAELRAKGGVRVEEPSPGSLRGRVLYPLRGLAAHKNKREALARAVGRQGRRLERVLRGSRA